MARSPNPSRCSASTLRQYEQLFEEKLDLFVELLKQEPVTWQGKLRAPLDMLAIIGGDPKRFAPYVDLYQRAYREFGRTAKPIGVHSPGYVAETDAQAREELFADYKTMRDRIGQVARLAADGAATSSCRRPTAARSTSARPRRWRERLHRP